MARLQDETLASVVLAYEDTVASFCVWHRQLDLLLHELGVPHLLRTRGVVAGLSSTTDDGGPRSKLPAAKAFGPGHTGLVGGEASVGTGRAGPLAAAGAGAEMEVATRLRTGEAA